MKFSTENIKRKRIVDQHHEDVKFLPVFENSLKSKYQTTTKKIQELVIYGELKKKELKYNKNCLIDKGWMDSWINYIKGVSSERPSNNINSRITTRSTSNTDVLLIDNRKLYIIDDCIWEKLRSIYKSKLTLKLIEGKNIKEIGRASCRERVTSPV